MSNNYTPEQLITACLPDGDTSRRDFRPIYADAEKLDTIISCLAETLRASDPNQIDFIASPEANGYILGALLAQRLHVGFIALRKGYAAPADYPKVSYVASYIDHRDHVQSLVLPCDLIPQGSRVLFVDDWIGTAATAQAALTLMEEAGCILEGIMCLGVDDNAATAEMMTKGELHSIIKR